MLLKYIGTSASEEDVAKACGTTELGTTPFQMVKMQNVVLIGLYRHGQL